MKPLSRDEWLEVRQASQAAVLDGIDDVLLPYQQRVDALLETTSVLVVEKSRRIGLTWALAATCVLKAARQKKEGGMDALYISYSQEMTREFVDACAMWAKAFALAAAEEEEFLFEDVHPDNPDDTRQIKAFRIQFASSFEIVALSSAPRSLRGKQGICVIDEAAFVDSLAELLKSALAFLMWGGQVVVVSTHNGATNPFNELVQDCLAGRKPYKHVHIDLDQALSDGLYHRICQVTGKPWSVEAEADWRAELIKSYGDGADEELFCVPREGDGVWLTSTLIEARMTEDAEVLRFELPENFLSLDPLHRRGLIESCEARVDEALGGLDPTEVHGVGFDFARHVDLSIATVLGMTKTLCQRERLCVELRRWPYREQAALMIRIIRALARWQAALFDATGSGEAVAEDVARECGDKVVLIKLSQEWYRTNMPMLRRAFEENEISLIRDREHREDLRIVKIVRGIPVIPDIRASDGKGNKRHGDFAVSLALAHAALRTDPVTMDYQPIAMAPNPTYSGHASSGRMRDRPNHDDDDRYSSGRDLRGRL